MITRSKTLVAYHQFSLAPMGVDPVLEPGSRVPALQVTDGGLGLLVLTGVTDGPIWFSVGEPDPAGPRPGVPWEMVEESSMTITADLYYAAPTVDDSGLWDPVFVPTVPGRHRVTVFGRGKGTAADRYLDPDSEPVEEYAVWIRPEAG